MTKLLNYTIILTPDPEGGFTVVVPSLPGCVTYGKNLKEAQAMAKDAIIGYLASLKKHGEPIPSVETVLTTTVKVEESSSAVYA